MATQIQFRRGNTSQHSTFTGAVGEVTVDTEKNVVVVHDGSTAGGFPVANSSVAATAYSNAVSYTDTAIGTANTAMAANAATAYSNATSYADTIAGTAYSNAVAYAASNTYVNNTFAPLSGATFTGAVSGTDLTLSGNLTVSGTRTYVNSTTLDVGDNIITLNADLGASAPSENAGVEVMRGTSANVQIIWNETSDAWTFTNDGSTYYELASNTDVDTAYSNAVSYADTIAGTSYSNAVSYAASNTYVNSTFALIDNPSFTGNATFDTSTLFVDATNNRVGIGTSSPSTELEVNGVLTASGLTYPSSDGTNGQVITTDGSGNLSWTNSITSSSTDTFTNKTISGADNTLKPNEFMTIAVSDETTSLTTGTAKISFRAPFAMTLYQIPRASLSTASSSGLVTVDINESGTTILSTKLTIDANEKTSTTAATAAVLSDTSIADDAEITIDIDAAGTEAKGLKVILYYRRT